MFASQERSEDCRSYSLQMSCAWQMPYGWQGTYVCNYLFIILKREREQGGVTGKRQCQADSPPSAEPNAELDLKTLRL